MSDLLSGTIWQTANNASIQGDLSARHYQRLTASNGDTAILMDASQQAESVEPFLRITAWLHKNDVSVPEVMFSSPNKLLLEDFGDLKLSSLTGAERKSGYALCIDLLLTIRRCDSPELFRPDPNELAGWIDVARNYPGAKAIEIDELSPFLETEFEKILPWFSSVSLRDFHADNIMWLENRSGIRRLGLLDYQDAFLTHPVYDLVSLLTDARTHISREFRNTLIDQYVEKSDDDPIELQKAFALFSAQRNLRILGIFARAAQTGKTHHVSKMPRVYQYYVEALEHPVFDPIRDTATAALPFPDDALLRSLQ